MARGAVAVARLGLGFGFLPDRGGFGPGAGLRLRAGVVFGAGLGAEYDSCCDSGVSKSKSAKRGGAAKSQFKTVRLTTSIYNRQLNREARTSPYFRFYLHFKPMFLSQL